MTRGRIFSPEIEEYIKDNCLGKYTVELTKMVNSKFNTNFSSEQVQNLKKRKGYKSYINGEDGRFQKGFVSPTKGQKLAPEHYEKSKKGMFKRGHTPQSWLPVGSEIIMLGTVKIGYLNKNLSMNNIKGPFQKGIQLFLRMEINETLIWIILFWYLGLNCCI